MLDDLCVLEPRRGFNDANDIPEMSNENIAEAFLQYPFILGDACAGPENEKAFAFLIAAGDEAALGRFILQRLKREVPGTILTDLQDRAAVHDVEYAS